MLSYLRLNMTVSTCYSRSGSLSSYGTANSLS